MNMMLRLSALFTTAALLFFPTIAFQTAPRIRKQAAVDAKSHLYALDPNKSVVSPLKVGKDDSEDLLVASSLVEEEFFDLSENFSKQRTTMLGLEILHGAASWGPSVHCGHPTLLQPNSLLPNQV